MNNKSQFAVFVIAIAVISMFLMYIIIVEPWTRWEMLYGPLPGENDTNGGTTPPTGQFYSASLNQYIGGTSGEQIGTKHTINNIFVEHPLVLSTIEVPSSIDLVARWLVDGVQTFDIPSFINSNNSESLELNFTLASTIGNPIVKVKFNDNTILERGMQLGEKAHFSIPVSQLGETNNFQIWCSYTGAPLLFWITQSCSFSDVTLQRARYLDSNAENTETVNVDSNEQDAAVMFVTFWTEQSQPGGMLEIYLNEDKVYEGYPSVGNESFEVKSPNLTESNIFTFKAEEGGAYRITKIDVVFRTEVEPRQFAVINLPDNVAQQIKASGKDLRFVLTVTEVVIDGWVYFKVYPAHILHTEGVMEGSVFADVPNSEIDTSANTIRIEGPNSKFYVSQFRIIEKE